MSTVQMRHYHEMRAKVRAMARITVPDDNERDQSDREEHGGPAAVSGAGEAFPQRARATQRIAALGEMTGGIAHDFRNILTIIESALRLAEMNSGAPEKVSAYIAGAKDGVDRGLQLTSQLLTFAKQHERDLRAGNATQLIRNLELFLKYGAGSGNRIVLELTHDIPQCVLDPSQFNAAVLNLMLNARDAMPNGGLVRISTDRWEATGAGPDSPAPGAYVRVRVQDSGQGMSADVVRRIFDPLFTTKGEKGTGLGLPQVLAFMQLIGGYVNVSSEVGIGRTFDLFFPQSSPAGSSEHDNDRAKH